MIKQPTSEQMDVIQADGNLAITAGPGAGKTFTIVEKIIHILQDTEDYQGVIAISYTNKASNELWSRCKEMQLDIKASFFGTIDKFCISELIMPFTRHLLHKNVTLEVKKFSKKDKEYQSLKRLEASRCFSQELIDEMLVYLTNGIIPLNLTGIIALYILQYVPEAMEYLQARYTHIFIDEYQDCGYIQHNIFLFLVNHGIKGIAVGDKDQAIYGFENRWPKFLNILTKRDDFHSYSLIQNFRCHSSISNYASSLYMPSLRNLPIKVSDKRVFKVDINGDEHEIAKKIDQHLPEIMRQYRVEQRDQIAILCRTNNTVNILDKCLKSPHKSFKFDWLANVGSRLGRLYSTLLLNYFSRELAGVDIAERVYSQEYDYQKYRKLLMSIQTLNELPIEELKDHINLFSKIANLLEIQVDKKGNDLLYTILSDKDEYNVYQPAKTNEINIMTIHKAKGLEFKIVFQMDMYQGVFSPKRKSTQDDVKYLQALNLHYVALTRASEACFLLNGTHRYNKEGNCEQVEPSSFYDIPGLNEQRINLHW